MNGQDWFYMSNGQRQGPVGFDELLHLASQGQLGGDDLVWAKGMQDWQAASTVQGLFATPAPVPVPPPQTPAASGGRATSKLPWLIAAGVAACAIVAGATWWITTRNAVSITNVDQLKEVCKKITGNNFDMSRDSKTVSCVMKFAEQGNAFAQNVIGSCYSDEKCAGIEKDDVQAVAWYRKVAEQGNADGQVNLGIAYTGGLGIDKDAAQGVTWYRKAAEQGNAKGQFTLGIAYLLGRGVNEDETQARHWLRLAADNKEDPETSSAALFILKREP